MIFQMKPSVGSLVLLMSPSISPSGILVDWGQLEVFAKNGVYSYSEQFAFTPEMDDIELTPMEI